jgi:DNA polymerase III subunit delta
MTPRSAVRPSPPDAEAEELPPVHLVLGPEDVLGDRAVAAVLRSVRRRSPEAEVVEVEPDRYTRGDLAARASPSLFADVTVLVVQSLESAPDELLAEARALVEQPVPDVVLVLRHRSGQRGKGLLDAARKAGAAVQDCPKITSEADKTTFVMNEFRRMRRKISPEAVAALIQALGQDVRELASACAQLVSDTADAEGRSRVEIGVDVVDRYFGGRVEATGFAVADAALAGRPDQALGLLRHALSCGVDPVPIVAVLALGLRSLAKVSTTGSARSAEAARSLAMAPWQVDKARRQLRGWSPEGLAEAIDAVAAADLAVKGGLPQKGRRAGDPVYAVEKAILTIGRVRNP